MVDLSKYHIHDLTHPFNDSIAGYSDAPARTLAKDGWNAKWLRIYSHAGTHMDAPHHFEVTPETIDQYTPERLMGKAWLVRIPITQPKQLLTISDLGFAKDQIGPKDSLLLQTNWSQKLGQPAFRDDLPRISESLARWCVDKQIKMLGVEPPSVADVDDLPEVTLIHEILLGGGVIIIEGLINLDKIQQDQVFLMALPLKIEKGDGAPARVLALEEKSDIQL